jgi:hypothetical protein
MNEGDIKKVNTSIKAGDFTHNHNEKKEFFFCSLCPLCLCGSLPFCGREGEIGLLQTGGMAIL